MDLGPLRSLSVPVRVKAVVTEFNHDRTVDRRWFRLSDKNKYVSHSRSSRQHSRALAHFSPVDTVTAGGAGVRGGGPSPIDFSRLSPLGLGAVLLPFTSLLFAALPLMFVCSAGPELAGPFPTVGGPLGPGSPFVSNFFLGFFGFCFLGPALAAVPEGPDILPTVVEGGGGGGTLVTGCVPCALGEAAAFGALGALTTAPPLMGLTGSPRPRPPRPPPRPRSPRAPRPRPRPRSPRPLPLLVGSPRPRPPLPRPRPP